LCVSLMGMIPLAGVQISAGAGGKDKAVTPFNGKDLSGWKLRGDAKNSKWQVGYAEMDEKNQSKLVFKPLDPKSKDAPQMVDVERSMDIYTEEKFGDCTIEVEFMVPKGSNSGVYVMGEYEVQILDSYGVKKPGPGDVGGIYNTAAPKVNAAKKPGE